MRREGKKKNGKFLLILLITTIMFLLGGTVINYIIAGGLEGEDGGFKNPFGGKKERINILVFGVDAPDNESVKGTRSDSIMLLSMDSSGKNPVLISIPRDTRVEIPGRKSPDKINHAHSHGQTELLVKTVEKMFDIKVNHYVRINYKAVAEVVDALGGVEVNVPMHMKYTDRYDGLYIDIPKGLQVLDGENAIHYLRFRKGYADADLGRIQAQQEFVRALKEKALSPSLIPKIPKLVEIFFNNVSTNITKGKMLSMGSKAVGLNNEEILKVTLSGKPGRIGGISYHLVDNEELMKIKNTYLVIPNEKNIPSKVVVLNGSGVTGVASIFRDQLEEVDIKVSDIGNHDSNVETSYIEYNGKFEKKAKEIAKLLKIKQLIKVTEENPEVDILVIIGTDLTK